MVIGIKPFCKIASTTENLYDQTETPYEYIEKLYGCAEVAFESVETPYGYIENLYGYAEVAFEFV